MKIHENPHKILIKSSWIPITFHWLFPIFQGATSRGRSPILPAASVRPWRCSRPETSTKTNWGFDGMVWFFLGISGMIFLGFDGIWWCFLGDDRDDICRHFKQRFPVDRLLSLLHHWGVLAKPHSLLKKTSALACRSREINRKEERNRKELPSGYVKIAIENGH
jgi:hypothetical protein